MNIKKVSIILGTYNRYDFLRLTIETIRAEVKDISHEIIVIDGGSTDGTLVWLLQQKDIITIVQHNRGLWNNKEIERKPWGYFMNLGFKIASGKYICMLSDDCLVIPQAIINGIALFDQEIEKNHNNIGAIAFYFRDWPLHETYHVETPFDKMFVNHGLYLNQALKDVNYIDEENFFFYGADVDLCFKMWEKGYKVIDSPTSFIEHYPFANVKVRNSNIRNDELSLAPLVKKWQSIFPEIQMKDPNKIIQKSFEDRYETVHLYKELHKNNDIKQASKSPLVLPKKVFSFFKNMFD